MPRRADNDPMEKAEQIRLLVLDVDGVMTDGSIYLDDDGREIKQFNIRDGLAIRLWIRLGFQVAILTGRSGQALRHRAAELGISRIFQGAADKARGLEEVLEATGFKADEVAYVGDDWPDLAAMSLVAIPIAVGDAAPEVREAAAWRTASPGGRGAVREAIEFLLRGKGLYEKAIDTARGGGHGGSMA